MTLTPHLTRYAVHGVTLLGDPRRPSGVTLAFTERTGGLSEPPYASLNVGIDCGDDADVVRQNRLRALEALGCAKWADRLVNPLQVHGDVVVSVNDDSDEAVAAAQLQARAGADAVVCTADHVPVLLCYADCVPVVLVAPHGFAVVHSGRKGCELRICARALERLCADASCDPSEVLAYVGPHVAGEDYEVAPDMARAFAELFGEEALLPGNRIDLGFAVRKTLVEAGVPAEAICDECPSTATNVDRFFSYRAEDGRCGRHGAMAVLGAVGQEGGSFDD